MINEINKLTKMMSSGTSSLDELKDLQAQYADFYEAVNKRVMRVNDLIKLGRLTEAKMAMDQDENLIKVIQALHFPDLKKWIEKCKSAGVSLNEFITNDVIDKFKEVYFESSGIDDLIAKYRKLVLVGTDIEKIQLLRQIIKRNPNDKSWADSLRPLEEKYIRELASKYADSNTESFSDAEEYYNEIVATKWVCDVPADLKSEVKDNYLKLLHGKVLNKAENLIEAMPEDDLKIVSKTLKEYEELQSTIAFELPEPLQQKIKLAKKKLNKANEDRVEEEKFNKVLDNVQQIMSKEMIDALELKLAYDKLKAFERPFDLSIRNNVEFKLEALERQVARKMQYTRGLLIVGTIIAVAIIFFSYKSYTKSKAISSLSNEVDFLMNDKKYDEALELYKRWIEEKKDYRADLDVLMIRDRIDSGIEEHKANLARIENLKKELSDIRMNNFNADEDIINFNLKEAHELFNTHEDLAYLKRWELAWRIKNSKEKSLNNEKYIKILKEAHDVLALKDDVLSISERLKRYKDTTAKVTQVMLLKNNVSELVASQMADAYKELKDKIESMGDLKVTREENTESFNKTLERLKKGEIDIKTYRQEIEAIFVNDKEYDLYVKLMSDLESINHASSIADFNLEDFDAIFSENTKYEQDHFARNPYKLLVNGLYNAKLSHTKLKNKLQSYFTNKLFTELYEVEVTEKRKDLDDVEKKFILLSNKDLIESKKTFKVNDTETNYYKVKYCSTVEGKLQQVDYTFYSDKAVVKEMKHVQYTNKILEILLHSKTEDFFYALYQIHNKIIQDSEVNPFIKVLFVETFLKEMKAVGVKSFKTDEYLATLNRLLYKSVVWLASEDSQTKLKEKELKLVLDKNLKLSFSLLEETFKSHSTGISNLLKSLKVRLHYAGVVSKEGNDWVFNTITQSEELISPQWNVKNNHVTRVVIAKKNEQGFFEPTVKGRELIYHGMPFMIVKEN